MLVPALARQIWSGLAEHEKENEHLHFLGQSHMPSYLLSNSARHTCAKRRCIQIVGSSQLWALV